MSEPTQTRETIGDLVITPRPLSAYRDMFLLIDDDLTAGPILDCPGGASPFGAHVRARGGTVTSVDPAYHWSRCTRGWTSCAPSWSGMACTPNCTPPSGPSWPVVNEC